MTLLRTQLGSTLRGHRLRQRRTLRDVSGAARVSLGYLSEVERGQKEASSELLASICDALDVELADLLAEVSLELRLADPARQPVRSVAGERVVREAVRDAEGTAEPAAALPAAPAAAEPALALVGGGTARGSLRRGDAFYLAA
ncbi:helix-turn-helix domain-containing protein [Modestobacter lapidis]|nr:helix-turn-helix transcriptional regulator [Modestobacter lapidis]